MLGTKDEKRQCLKEAYKLVGKRKKCKINHTFLNREKPGFYGSTEERVLTLLGVPRVRTVFMELTLQG